MFLKEDCYPNIMNNCSLKVDSYPNITNNCDLSMPNCLLNDFHTMILICSSDKYVICYILFILLVRSRIMPNHFLNLFLLHLSFPFPFLFLITLSLLPLSGTLSSVYILSYTSTCIHHLMSYNHFPSPHTLLQVGSLFEKKNNDPRLLYFFLLPLFPLVLSFHLIRTHNLFSFEVH